MRSRDQNQQQNGPAWAEGAKEDEKRKENWPTRLAGSRCQTQAEIERNEARKQSVSLRRSAGDASGDALNAR